MLCGAYGPRAGNVSVAPRECRLRHRQTSSDAPCDTEQDALAGHTARSFAVMSCSSPDSQPRGCAWSLIEYRSARRSGRDRAASRGFCSIPLLTSYEGTSSSSAGDLEGLGMLTWANRMHHYLAVSLSFAAALAIALAGEALVRGDSGHHRRPHSRAHYVALYGHQFVLTLSGRTERACRRAQVDLHRCFRCVTTGSN